MELLYNFTDLLLKTYDALLPSIIGFFGDLSKSNYVEYFSWISSGVISFIGLLSIFFNIHYQNDILKAKTTLREIKTGDKMTADDLKKTLQSYYFSTTQDISGYIETVGAFRVITYALSALWLFSCIAYIISTSALGGKILIFTASILMIGTLLVITNKFHNIYKKDLILFPEFLNIDTFIDTISKNYDMVLDLLIPTFTIELSHDEKEIHFYYRSELNLSGYTLTALIKEKDSPSFYMHLGIKVSDKQNTAGGISSVEINNSTKYIDKLVQKLSTLKPELYDCYICLFCDKVELLFSGKLKIENIDGNSIIICSPSLKCTSSIPKPVKDFRKQLKTIDKIETIHSSL